MQSLLNIKRNVKNAEDIGSNTTAQVLLGAYDCLVAAEDSNDGRLCLLQVFNNSWESYNASSFTEPYVDVHSTKLQYDRPQHYIVEGDLSE